MPPDPGAADRRLYDAASAAEHQRADALLQRAGFSRGDLARAGAALAAVPRAEPCDAGVDAVTRRRARAVLGEHGHAPSVAGEPVRDAAGTPGADDAGGKPWAS